MFTRRATLTSTALAAAGLALSGLPRLARAAETARNEGSHRIAIGDTIVTTLSDGFIDAPLGAFPRSKPEEIEVLTRRAFRPDEPVRLAVNGFLVSRGGENILIDSGARGFAPTVGHLVDNLRAAGVEPASIRTILLTHLHADHVNGLVAEAHAVFPNAELVMPQAEHAFWLDEGIASRAPDGAKPFFAMAVAAVKPYGDRVRLVQSGEVAPGIEAVPLPGHTPGHTGYRISSGDQQMLIWGDIVHATVLQFARPEWTIAFDVDQDAAVATRKRVLDMVSRDRILVAGAHLEFPGAGHVVVGSGDTAYEFVPASWSYTL